MTPNARSLLVLLAALGVDACASAPPPPTETAQRPRRRRRRAAPPAAAPVVASTAAPAATPPAAEPVAGTLGTTAEAPALVPTVRRVGAGSFEPRPGAPSMGSPVVARPTGAGRTLTARWAGTRAAPRIVCEGEGSPLRPSMQSPYDPTNAMIVRAFQPVEQRVLACRPPMNREGRVPVRVLFSGSGLPLEVSLSADVTREQGLCLGAAICNVHLGAFRAPNATVNFGFVAAYVAEDNGPAEE